MPPARRGIAWAQLLPLVDLYWQLLAGHVAPRHRAGRLKQWLNLLRRHYPEAQQAFQTLRESNDPAKVALWLAAQRLPSPPSGAGAADSAPLTAFGAPMALPA